MDRRKKFRAAATGSARQPSDRRKDCRIGSRYNSSRLLTSFFGVSGWVRVLVPINFRLRPDEVRYIVENSGARALYVDPEPADSLAEFDCEHTFVLGTDTDLYADPMEGYWAAAGERGGAGRRMVPYRRRWRARRAPTHPRPP